MFKPQLETFVRVADAGSFNKAADEAHITPPSPFIKMRNDRMQKGDHYEEINRYLIKPWTCSQSCRLWCRGQLILKQAIAAGQQLRLVHTRHALQV